MKKIRVETDSFGKIEVPSDKYWGAQTQRSLINFPIGDEKQPTALIRALGVIKAAAARVNMVQGNLDRQIGEAILQASIEVAEGKLNKYECK